MTQNTHYLLSYVHPIIDFYVFIILMHLFFTVEKNSCNVIRHCSIFCYIEKNPITYFESRINSLIQNCCRSFHFQPLCFWYLFQWFANLTKFRIFKCEYLFSFFNWENKSLIGPKKTLTNQTPFFSVLNWFWGAESKQ